MFLSRVLLSLFCLLSSSFIWAEVPLEKETVNFVTEANYYPFEYLDENNLIKGFDIDVANAVCEAVNLTCTFSHQNFDSLLLTLQFGRFDAVIAALDITKKRLEIVDFSDSYYTNYPVFISKKSPTKKFYGYGKVIAVHTDSSNQDYLLQYSLDNSFIISYPSLSNAFEDLRSGRIDMIFADNAIASDFLKKSDNEVHFSIDKTETLFAEKFSQGYGIAVKKGNHQLQQRFNLGLEIIFNNGTYKKIYNRYF